MELNVEGVEETRSETGSSRFHGHDTGIGLESAFLWLHFHTSPTSPMFCHLYTRDASYARIQYGQQFRVFTEATKTLD